MYNGNIFLLAEIGMASQGASSVEGCPCPQGSPFPAQVAGQPLTQAQEREADRLRHSGGLFVVVREFGYRKNGHGMCFQGPKLAR